MYSLLKYGGQFYKTVYIKRNHMQLSLQLENQNPLKSSVKSNQISSLTQ